MPAPILSQSPAADARLQPAAPAPAPPAASRYRFEVRYHNRQGALMRLLGAASRRGLDFEAVRADADPRDPGLHRLTLVLRAGAQHVAQICRDWRVMVDAAEVLQPLDLDREPESAPRTI